MFDRFTLAMLVAIALALLAPSLGAHGGPLALERVIPIAIGLLFFLHGATLSPAALARGTRNWRLHLLAQGATFALFPLLSLAIFMGLPQLPAEIRLGFVFLGALSSTIASSIAMTAAAGGNVAGAVFNATLSSLLGLFLTPLIVAGIAGGGHDAGFDLGGAVRDILLTLLAPFAAGQAARPLLMRWIDRHKARVRLFDRSVIVIIVYAAFCDFALSRLWTRYDAQTMIIIVLAACAMLAIVIAAIMASARALRLPRDDEAAALFCGATKSLANGMPIAGILFAGNPALGAIVLPLIVYHQAQLFVGALIARRYGQTLLREAP